MVTYEGSSGGCYMRASGNAQFMGVVSDHASPVQILSTDYDRTYIVISGCGENQTDEGENNGSAN